MKILIEQAFHEKGVAELERKLQDNPEVDMVLFPEGYLSNKEALIQAYALAKKYNKTIITSYKDEQNKDRASIIDQSGELVLERAKTPEDERLYHPSEATINGVKIGYLLCREVFLGLDGFDKNETFDFIVNPIGVGMFSEEQFEEWTNEARKIAIQLQTTVIGASHADGSYRNCGVSIPLAYCFDKNGDAVFISKNDLSTRIVDFRRGR